MSNNKKKSEENGNKEEIKDGMETLNHMVLDDLPYQIIPNKGS